MEKPIILDAMGGDFAPQATVEGAVQAAKDGLKIILVGQEDKIKAELSKFPSDLPIEIVHADKAISMNDQATDVRRERNLSINIAMKLLKENRGSAVVAQGHTGATLASALLTLGRLPGAERPAILLDMPTIKGHIAALDVGANADVKPPYLQGFALMGAAYMHPMHNKENPSVRLLSIGEEEGKGSALINETFDLLKNTPGLNFYGNVEGRDAFKGTTDVFVTDGFTGNVMLKFAEGEAKAIFYWVREALTKGDFFTKLGGLLVTPALRAVAAKLDPSEYGAQPLLGVKGLVFVGHGSSDAKAVHSALKSAARAVKNDLLDKVSARLSVLQKPETETN